MSSDILSRAIDVNKFGVIYAGAQKNIGPSGVTLVIVRNDLLKRVDEQTPTMQKWSTHANKNSLFNTCPTWAIYMCKLCMGYIKAEGGISEIEKRNKKKAALLYDLIDSSGGFYKGHAKPDSRSRMNVTFNLPSEDLEKMCVEEAMKHDLIGLKGHRSIGGMRASIYNAMSIEGVEVLVEFLQEFQEDHQ
jgi:phosphoserine aminotransferase